MASNGTVTQVIGSTFDAQFPENALPEIYNAVEIDFTVENGPDMTVRLELAGQEAQKSHGLCQGDKPDIANLPAGSNK